LRDARDAKCGSAVVWIGASEKLVEIVLAITVVVRICISRIKRI
jgi:hypothetical protein